MKRYPPLFSALYRLYEHSGFSLAGAVAFSFLVSLFPFCIFVGALAGIFGGRDLASTAISQLFAFLPKAVAEALAPQVEAIMGASRIDLLTLSGFLALFFATSAIETMRTALNSAYRVLETRPYPVCLLISMIFVFLSAASMLFLTWIVVFGPAIASQVADFEPEWAKSILDSSWIDTVKRYSMAAFVITSQLVSFHLWLAAGKRRIADVLPGIVISVLLWIMVAALYSHYLNLSDYKRFYAGLSQLMIALIFFQFTAIIIILGAEINRGVMELKKISNDNYLSLKANK
ncbi:MAG: YihY/virulence factor BrkB family protein [Hyphomicrobium sp.]